VAPVREILDNDGGNDGGCSTQLTHHVVTCANHASPGILRPLDEREHRL